jgi:hypothetical protein
MIALHPIPQADYECVYCRTPLKTLGWIIPGMRNLAELRCTQCGREFYGDLRAGQALYTPLLLEKETGAVHDDYGVKWFADWMREAYARRTSEPLAFKVQERAPVTRAVVLLNCLDAIYGHALLKLLNAQHYLDHQPDVDLIVMVQPFLEWMIPEGVAQVWMIDLPARRGTEWNDWLAGEIRRRLEAFSCVKLSVALSHPHPDDFEIERFTRITPFALDEWARRLERPTVTFIWRDDRLWQTAIEPASDSLGKIKRRLKRSEHPLSEQRRQVSLLADALSLEWPSLDFAVAGTGEPGNLPANISDLRRTEVNAGVEREWCERYAASHVVVGVHGSNMLLPSAHAGGCVELIGSERWGNFLQDILFRPADCRELFFRYRFMPDTTGPAQLAQLLSSMLRGFPGWLALMGAEACVREKNHSSSRVRASGKDGIHQEVEYADYS